MQGAFPFMRVFKNKWFNRWARGEGISNAVLLNAAAEIATGKHVSQAVFAVIMGIGKTTVGTGAEKTKRHGTTTSRHH
jgi:hypothetical protein